MAEKRPSKTGPLPLLFPIARRSPQKDGACVRLYLFWDSIT